jgi:protein subunit release factor B
MPEAPKSSHAGPLPEPLDPERVLAECELEFVRASGPGGQHRNRRETGVRLTHLPTGVVVMATERRSQAANRRLALERMVERLERRRHVRRPRVPSRKSRGVRTRELDAKRHESTRKQQRKPVRGDD